MKTRAKVAAAMIATAFLLWIGAVGNADYNGFYSLSDYIIIGAGLTLTAIAFPIGGGELMNYEEDD